MGKNVPSDAVISLICREFNVREEWLRTGEGEMFKPKPSDILDQLAYKYKLFNFDYVMIEKFLAMPPDLRRAIYDHFHDVDAALAEMDPYAPAYAGTELQQSTDKIAKTEKSLEGRTIAGINPSNMSDEELGKFIRQEMELEEKVREKSEA